MSTSLLYHAFGIRGYQYQATKFHSGGMTIRVAQAREKLCCPACGSSKVRIVGKRTVKCILQGALC